jgi:beta-hydroxyacyl-ACP dehydratase FabZ
MPRRSAEAPPKTAARGFSYQEITELLPHRFPFLLVDRVVEFEDGAHITALKNVTVNEPFFSGHFPEQPLMPGVLICEALAQAGGLLAYSSTDGVRRERALILAGLDGVRFRRPVTPGDQLRLEVTLKKRHRPLWKMSSVARVDGRVVAEADLVLMEIERRLPE